MALKYRIDLLEQVVDGFLDVEGKLNGLHLVFLEGPHHPLPFLQGGVFGCWELLARLHLLQIFHKDLLSQAYLPVLQDLLPEIHF